MPPPPDTAWRGLAPGPRRLENVFTAWHLQRLLRSDRLSPAQTRALQTQKLRRLLVFAYRRHAFYRELMSQAGLRPERLRDPEELGRLPVIDKRLYREFTEATVGRSPDLYARYFRDATSGSTGLPLRLYRTWGERGYMLAKFLRLLLRNGYSPLDRGFWVPSPKAVRRRDTVLQRLGLMRRWVVPFSEPTETLVAEYLRARPNFVFANKCHLVQMALCLKAQGLAVRPPKLCVCVGEAIDGASRSLIEDAFGRPGLLDVYGALELSSLAFRRVNRDDAFTFNHDTDILELTDRDPRHPGIGTGLITDLHIYSFPLIRYSLGDRLDTEERDGRLVVKRVLGRSDDLLVFPDGTTCGGPMIEVVMEERPAIRQYRVIQERPDQVRVLVVLAPGTDEQALRQDLIAALRQQIHGGVQYQIERVPALLPEPNGKLRMLVSSVARAALPPG